MQHVPLVRGLVLFLAFGLSVPPAHAAGVVARWEIGPAQRSDLAAFDPVRHRLFVTAGNKAYALDAKTGAQVGDVSHLADAHDIVLAEDLKLGFASNGASNTITAFDIETLRPRDTLHIKGWGPDGLVYVPPLQRLYSFNAAHSVSTIDARNMKLLETTPLPARAESPQWGGGERLFFNLATRAGAIGIFDFGTGKFVAQWPLPGCEMPTGLAIDLATQRLFSACANHVLVVTDGQTGKQIGRVPIGSRPDGALFDPATQLVFVPNGGDGTLTIVRQNSKNTYAVVNTIATEKNARVIAYDEDQRRVFLPLISRGKLSVLVVDPQ